MPANGVSRPSVRAALGNTHLQACVPNGDPTPKPSLTLSPCKSYKADARTRTGDPFIRVKRVHGADSAISLQKRDQFEGTSPWKSIQVHSAPAMCSNGVPIQLVHELP
jgi:hypothetical protein